MGVTAKYVEKAEQGIPALHRQIVYPERVIEVVEDKDAFQGWSTQATGSIEGLKEQSFGKNDRFVLDFGGHQVGYLQLSVKPTGSPPDAPLRLKLVFGEMPCEIGESFEDYEGWLSRSWLQEEIINVDVLPCEIKLPRRYTFRYLKVTVLETSIKYKVAFPDIHCEAVTSADASVLEPLPGSVPEELRRMDRIALRTLENCMQTVFEDGPKRDRRLWIGDLRLQALVNYETFRNNELVKRCLYLFGGMTLAGGEAGACIFEQPRPHVDDTYFFDYSLFFTATLHDYYKATGDMETLQELWPLAWEQLELAYKKVGSTGIIEEAAAARSFIDWHGELDKQAAAQGVFIYCLKRGHRLALDLDLQEAADLLAERIERLSQAAITELYDEQTGLFASGEQRQISWASQVWMVLAEILGQKGNHRLLERLLAESPAIRPNTPYMFHHLIEALFVAGCKELAVQQMHAYWGKMVEQGADTFWEVFNPEDDKLSPYGSHLINSYCHAWSCTPSYFIRRYLV
ncbi:sugar hydrolase [Paenibacillus sp. FSL E2-0201]|uniref:alpha-L-rhamnosidase-related protein n=1 Tax=Paenibacillus sp. FSL E2-0201 TaxID=2954726 RepID=UPI0030DB9737